MLKSLYLKNVALIKEAVIDFESGLNVLSGETGSGKSVIIDSINFVLGAKADKTMIRYGENECVATATFDISNLSEVNEVLSELGVEENDELIVTRRLTQDSKSTVRVNGIPFTLGMLKSVTSLLVDVHGQSEHYSLLKESEQLNVLDRFAGESLAELKRKCFEICDRIKDTDKRLKSFGGSERERAVKADILKFQIEEIESAELKEGEESELLVQRKKIQSTEKLSDAFSTVQSALNGENCAIDYLNSAIRGLSAVIDLDDEYRNMYDRLKAAKEDLSDISYTAETALENLDVDAASADRIEDRLEKIRSLKRKYGQNESEILLFLQNAKDEYSKLIDFDAEYAKLTDEKKSLIRDLNVKYKKMSEIRRAAAGRLTGEISNELKELGMKNATFEISFSPTEFANETRYGSNGGDSIQFMFSANLGEPVKSMSKIISGGEMSRFMLSLKTAVSSYHEISTYIFDEIDAGISGKTAEVVAEKFSKIAKKIQVIAISHLPQIVSFADASFKIAKFVDGDKTFTSVNRLTDENKTEEVVRLIGGDMTSVSAVSHAREMIEKADAYKSKIL